MGPELLLLVAWESVLVCEPPVILCEPLWAD